jgi:DGQHR domain-containing protein
MKSITKEAFSLGNGNIDYYVTVMSAEEIFEFSKVSRVEEDPREGYQRNLSEKRAAAIAEYLNSGNIIPGAIVLSAQSKANLSYSNGKLTIDLIPGSFFVIDGQHRLYGSKMATDDVLLPVCIFDGLDHSAEVHYFLDINSNQKGVPKTLRIELMKFLAEPDSIDAIRNRLFKDLNESPESPLYDRMNATSSGPGKLSLVPFQLAIDPLLTGDILGQFSYEDKKRLLINYLTAVEGALDRMEVKSGTLVTSAFFQAIFKVFEKVCHLSIMHNKNYSATSMSQILDGIVGVDMDRYSGSNQQAINELSSELASLLEIHSQKLGTPVGLL